MKIRTSAPLTSADGLDARGSGQRAGRSNDVARHQGAQFTAGHELGQGWFAATRSDTTAESMSVGKYSFDLTTRCAGIGTMRRRALVMLRTLRTRSAFIAVALLVGGSACARNATSVAQATSAPSVVASDADASAATTAPIAPGALPTAAPPSFTDIAGVNGYKQIVGFAQLGAIDPVSGEFRPGAAVLRRDFIRWLVRANNLLWADTPAKRINLADSTETSAFPDIKTDDPELPYIQGMQDAAIPSAFPTNCFGLIEH